MRILLFIFLAFPMTSFSYEKEGFYTIDNTGWVTKETLVGEVFICSECPDLVQVQISYGPEAGADAPFHNDRQFTNAFNTKEKKKQLAEMLLESGMPSENYKLNIIAVEDDEIGGLKAIRYSAAVDAPGGVEARETTLITMHKNRMVKFSANFYEGKLSEKSAILLQNLSDTVRFYN
ncbi:hypothetical protein JW294_01870 [Morganella morganii]|uniref:hypothetical protein n=1 Tax=Morganella morganii TaxID=582 RepID=UPI0019679A8D|nr:hypothetical protein [Morganella morganii]QSB76884.1 hypothetical protein JW294_01870 [Morganella morganii]